jgi:hypothetical protein
MKENPEPSDEEKIDEVELTEALIYPQGMFSEDLFNFLLGRNLPPLERYPNGI